MCPAPANARAGVIQRPYEDIKAALEQRTSYTFDGWVRVLHIVRLRLAPHSRTSIEVTVFATTSPLAAGRQLSARLASDPMVILSRQADLKVMDFLTVTGPRYGSCAGMAYPSR